MLTEFRHIGIVVNDLDVSLRFYRDLLGLKVLKQMEEGGKFIDKVLGLQDVQVTTVKMGFGQHTLIELLHYDRLSRKNGSPVKEICINGLTHIAFTVKNLEETYDRLKKHGVGFVSEPEISPDRYAKVTFCKDPEGNFIELVEVLNDK